MYILFRKKKAMETRIIKNISNKNERCWDVKTQKACEQRQVGPKIKQTTSI